MSYLKTGAYKVVQHGKIGMLYVNSGISPQIFYPFFDPHAPLYVPPKSEVFLADGKRPKSKNFTGPELPNIWGRLPGEYDRLKKSVKETVCLITSDLKKTKVK